jgi:hypothetical protein
VASKTLIFPDEEETYIRAPTRISDDLPACIKGAAHWIIYREHIRKSQYHIEIAQGVDIPVEFINHRWHFLRWEDEEGYYLTRKN